MNDRIAKLKESVSKDKQKIAKLQDGIKEKEEKIRELENTELMNNLNSISTRGFAVNEIVEAIKNKDVDRLMGMMEASQGQGTEKSGTGSAFQITKEENINE
jgi:uncharacterized protein YjgD (DUF1641 family)